MLEAVLFDWGDTLMRWAWEPALLDAGHAAGLRALGRGPLPELTERFRREFLPVLWQPGTLEEVEYPALVRTLLAEAGVEVTDWELELFLEAEHEAWRPARLLASTTHALLESLRGRGLKVGLVSNALDPPGLLHRDLEQLGVAARLDVAVFSSEVGWRKPHPAIFERALSELGVQASGTLFVGDTLAVDIAGASALGMYTCQAAWFRADEDAGAPEPDFLAITQMDVLTAVRRLQQAPL
ncbi:MAG TPA: HAD family hydrolase [Gaiellaceae bacterium]|nr:HAD family hydrolase [Gaiellaceae bacterium]